MVCKSVLILPGEQEFLAAVLDRAAWPLFPGGNVRQKHLGMLVTLVANNPSLYIHSHRVRLLTHHLTCVLHLSQDQVISIELAALLHDIGKLAIPTSTLQKASRLTQEEFMHIKRHPAYGAVILKQMGMLSQVTHVVYHHHEHWDGGGYPAGLQGETIPLGARIVAIADAFEVMTSHRPYQAPRPPIQALEELRRCAGTQFDPVLVDRFCSSLEADLSGPPPIEMGGCAGTNGTEVLTVRDDRPCYRGADGVYTCESSLSLSSSTPFAFANGTGISSAPSL
jgi:putative nucleotidyltransferase with HDIG domain